MRINMGPVHQSILYEFQQGTSPFINANLIDDQKALIPKQNILYITINKKYRTIV